MPAACQLARKNKSSLSLLQILTLTTRFSFLFAYGVCTARNTTQICGHHASYTTIRSQCKISSRTPADTPHRDRSKLSRFFNSAPCKVQYHTQHAPFSADHAHVLLHGVHDLSVHRQRVPTRAPGDFSGRSPATPCCPGYPPCSIQSPSPHRDL